MPHELGGNELRRCRTMRQNVEHHQAVFDSAPRRNLVAQNNFLAIVVRSRIEEKLACVFAQHVGARSIQHRLRGSARAARGEDGPAGKAARNFLNIFLRVAAVNAECVQFHQLARVVFIDAPSLLPLLLRVWWLLLSLLSGVWILLPQAAERSAALLVGPTLARSRAQLGVGTNALEIVEVEKHRRTLRGCQQQIGKLANRIGTDRVAIVRGQQPAISALACKHVEVIGPEIHHHFLQLSLAINRAQNSRCLQLSRNALRQLQSVLLVVFAQRLTILGILKRVRILVWIGDILFRIAGGSCHFPSICGLRLIGLGLTGCGIGAALHTVIASSGEFGRQFTTALKLFQ